MRLGMRLASDTGGTFTDLVTDDGRVLKVPSTPDDPGRAVRQGIAALAAGPVHVLAHGTTVATNALLERRGAVVALVTTEGLADVIEIARQDRPSLYDHTIDRPAPLVPRPLRFEVRERLDARGEVLVPLDRSSLPSGGQLAGVEAIAVCLLHADLRPDHERAVAEALAARGFDVTCSHEISPEFREYERTVTTVANAYLRPVCRRYLRGLADAAERVVVMTSAGGLVPAAEAAERPAALLLSGPAGGVAAGAAVAVANGYPDAVTFDMGGTSTDVCLVLGGRPEPAAERQVAGLPVRLPSLDVHTIGAGGGSIARVDPGGALVVGPESAGAVPGPACYGQGGTEPTVTDANLVAGRIPLDASFPGLGTLDARLAREALERAGVDAAGVLAVVNANMVQALRKVSVERGVDPRRLALVAFGGAGPLHACDLADALGMPCVIVPARAGVLSAAGILCAPEQRDLVRSWAMPGDHRGLGEARAELAAAALAALGAGDGEVGVEVETWLDCRYEGQSHELRVASVEGFHDAHRRHNGYARPGHPVEVVAVRAAARRRAPVALGDLPLVERAEVAGPAVVAEPDCTIWVPAGWRAEPGVAGALVLRRERDR
ncbi:hydantoinase/oxoprolinase family protein [Rhabdothermincola sediminis]|uniref:hydantoinase/oxoprolinase family protein n=1 Tax=Rhabdothermincola sediminis TaxID=2751370 RepID=UPI001AA088B3|nr:hydantoinase/oxoprolinase family protein [Rhabdothermincola sediminis]